MMLKRLAKYSVLAIAMGAASGLFAGGASSEVFVQCPGDTNGNAVEDGAEAWANPNQKCMHISAGDGFVNMSDIEATPTNVIPLNHDGSYAGPVQIRGRFQYFFGYADMTGKDPSDVLIDGTLAAEFAAPTIVLDEGDEFYLSLTNVGMAIRPDLFDAHTVHWHGFHNAAPIFDGVPDTSISIMMGSTLAYYYNVVEPGTYMWHCHVEATEHMQMGMLGNLYVKPAQNKSADGTDLNGHIHETGDEYAYNDGDGSTHYDVEFPIQLSSFDPDFHDASYLVQALPFAEMKDTFAMINGRGYPETLIEGPLHNSGNGLPTQPLDSLVRADAGQTILLRISNLSITEYFTLMSPSIRMKVIGMGARILRGQNTPDGLGGMKERDLYFETNSVNVGGGEAYDVLLDTTGMSPGTYFLYTSNLQYLSNNTEERGGIMTEIVLQ
ncbi:MAG: multicopper oxidase domain-containing protein [bacterium]|nr:multicopper oxidase domain-containing protein [bacterium]